MKYLRWLNGSPREDRPASVSRVIALRLEGLVPALVLRYLEEGLFQHLALLIDIGTRIELEVDVATDLGTFCAAMRSHGVHAALLPAAPLPATANLEDICAADRLQQERLIAVLKGRRQRVVACEFDMVAQLGRLYGTRLNDQQQLLMRDVYARMDEIVGKALSFVDDGTVLIVVLHAADSDSEAEPSQSKNLAFSSCRFEPALTSNADLAKIVLRRLNFEPVR